MAKENRTIAQNSNSKAKRRKMHEEEECDDEFDRDPWNFTTEEDQQIIENWTTFFVENEIEDSIFEFIGYDPKTGRFKEVEHDLSFLCESLFDRDLETVLRRVAYIFHPYYDPNEQYDLDEMNKMLAEPKPKPIHRMVEALKIPMEFLIDVKRRRRIDGRARKKRMRREELDSSGARSMFFLRLLRESLLEGASELKLQSFDWNVFDQQCREASVNPIPHRPLILTPVRLFLRKAETHVFAHLVEELTLADKLVFIYEALVRDTAISAKNRRRTEKAQLHHKNLFTVVFEHFSNADANWMPPTELTDKYTNKVNIPRIETRVETVQEELRTRVTHSESPSVSIRTKRYGSLDLAKTRTKRARSALQFDTSMNESNVLEISSIHGDESAVTLSHASENSSNLTNLEITDDFSSIRANETILAGGGGDRKQARREGDDEENHVQLAPETNANTEYASLLVPEINESLRKEREEQEKKNASFLPDQSNDIWSQLVNF